MNFQLKTTWQHIRRSPYQAAAAIFIMILTFFAGLSFAYLSIGADKLLSYLEKKPQIIIFFNDTVIKSDQIGDLKDKIAKTGKEVKLTFVTKEDALKIYQDRNKSDPLLLELVTAKTLPASLEIGTSRASDLPEIYDAVKDYSSIEDISYQKDIVNGLVMALRRIRQLGVGVFAFLVLTSMFIILTVIGMKISIHKEEIEVQRLIGASSWYIRWPFVFEGVCYGFFSACIAWVTVIVAVMFSAPYIKPYTSGLNLSPVVISFSDLKNLGEIAPFHLVLLIISLLSGVFVGAWGSLMAVWRYLKN
jgi:cell division transport system permease protein